MLDKRKAVIVVKIGVALKSVGKFYFSAWHHTMWLLRTLHMQTKKESVTSEMAYWHQSSSELLYNLRFSRGFFEPGPYFLKSYEGKLQL